MDTTPEQPADEHARRAPGKTRTWWHPLLAALLRWQLGEHYQLQEEVPVGLKPLQIDILLLHREKGELSEEARKILAGLVERFSEYTLLEFKSPSDTLRAGDFQTFLGYALLYRAQQMPLLAPTRMHLLVLAPRLSRPYREELETLGVEARQEQPGIWRLRGGVAVHPMWLLETEVLTGLAHPLVTLFSPRLLQDRHAIYEQLRQGGYGTMVVYLARQVQQFKQQGKEFAMQHLDTEEEMKAVMRDIWDSMTLEERLEVTPFEQIFQKLPPEEVVKQLSPQTCERLRQALRSPPPADEPSPPATPPG